MNIGNLKAWLNFDESTTKDFVADNHWEAFGNATISNVNAENNTALQLDGSSYLKLSNIELFGKDFTIDFWMTMDADTDNNGQIVSIVNPETGAGVLNVRRKTDTNNIEIWANEYSDSKKDSGYSYYANNNVIGNKLHIALTYHQDDRGVDYVPEIRLYINGVKATNTGWQIKGYNRKTYNVFIGKFSDTSSRYFKGSIDELRIYDGVKLWDANFTPPTSSDYDTLMYGFSADVIRKVCDSSKWTYENVGVIDSLINTSTAVQLTDLTADKSKTTKAFYQTKTGIKLFDVPTSNEIWIKFDVYFNGSKRWRCYDISTDVANNKTTGITAQTNGDISFFNRSTNVKQLTNLAKINQLQTVILYMKADATDGVIDVYTSDGGFIGEYVGEVNNGTAFSNLYLQSDGAGTFFSNIVISNNPLWFNDNAKVTINTDADFDTQRNILNDITVISDVERTVYKAPNVYNFDTERIILENSHDVDLVFDTARRIDITVNVDTDIERNITAEINLLCDTERLIESEITAIFDVER